MTDDDRLDDATLTRYLLGDLPADEASQLERHYFTDPQFLERLEAVEDELIDDYVRGTLAPESRQRFESHFLRPPRRQERVRTAAALLDRAGGRARAATEGGTRWILPLAASLLLAAVLTIVWLILENRTLRSRLDTLQMAHTRTQRELQSAKQDVERLRAERGPVPDPIGTNPQQPAVAPSDETPAPIATLVLVAGLSRDVGADVPTLRIPSRTENVRLEAVLEDDDGRTIYRAALARSGGRVVWEAEGLTPRRSDGDARLIVVVARARLAPGEHILTITGPDFVADYPFVVNPSGDL